MKVFSLFLATAIVCAAPTAFAADCSTRCCDEEFPKLTVQGEGKIETLADKATFNIRLRLEEKKLDKAFEESAKKINAINQALAAYKIKKEDIRNLGYVYQPLYEGKKIFTTIDRPSSYEVVYTLKVTVFNLEDLGKILTSLSDTSETSVYNLEYSTTRLEELKREALKQAAADARARAQKLAEGSGAILGKVMRIETGATVMPPMRAYAMDEARSGILAASMEKTAPQIESGQIEINASCTIIFAIQ